MTRPFRTANAAFPPFWAVAWLLVCTVGAASAAESSRQSPSATRPVRSLTLEEIDARLRSLAVEDERVMRLLSAIDLNAAPSEVGALLSGDPFAPQLRGDLAIRIAAEHVAVRRYEEALLWLDMVDPARCSSLELYWHFQAVARHQLVQMPKAAEAASELLQMQRFTNRRVRELAELILRDAKADKPGELPHVAHQMSDVERRLSLGRAGEGNQVLQEEVIAALDKLIKSAEEQRKQQQQQQQQLAQGSQGGSARPMPDSQPGELKGPGEVDDKDIPLDADWGTLPPAERERVAQQIIRDFPSHYREVISDYFRSLAAGPEQENSP